MDSGKVIATFSLFLFPRMDRTIDIKIISGGQTGVDRAALDFASKNSIPCDGWCPKGRLAEDGRIQNKYLLQETKSPDYRERTELNILNSDGTLILYMNKFDRGTGLTLHLCKKYKKPFLIIKLTENPDPSLLLSWVVDNHIRNLNIAGPRASSEQDIYQNVMDFLDKAFNLSN